MKRVILFDHDGTLSDSIPAVITATNLALEEAGFPGKTDDEIVDGMRLETILRMMSHANTKDRILGEKLAALFYLHLDSYIDKILLFPGIKKCISKLHSDGYTLGIISNNMSDVVSRVITQTGISSCFTVIIGEDNAKEIKPAPGGLLQASRILGADPSKCIYVGDSLSDSLSASSAGMQSVGVGWNTHDKVEIESLGFTYTIKTPDQLPLLVDKLNSV